MMSGSNPFRRKNGRAGHETPDPGVVHDRPTITTGKGVPSLTVEVPTSSLLAPTTKHVRIASPPVPISPETPASYASTPEEARYANPYVPASPQWPKSPRYTPHASSSDPFQASSSDGERDDVDEELTEKTQNSILESVAEDNRANAMPDTFRASLARFPGLRLRSTAPPVSDTVEGTGPRSGQLPRPALDVDAFKRLLLTGESGVQAYPHAPSQPAVISDSSSVNTDTASISQHSVLESPGNVIIDTPRTSQEWGGDEAVSERGVLMPADARNQKSPIPKPRHGLSLSDSSNSLLPSTTSRVSQARRITAAPDVENLRIVSPSDLSKPLPPGPSSSSLALAANPSLSPNLQSPPSTRRPPTPPLSRRGSQARKKSVRESFLPSVRPGSALNITATSSLDPEPTAAAWEGLPPSVARRQKRASDLEPPSCEIIAQGDDDLYKSSSQPQQSNRPQFKPQPPPSRKPSAATRRPRARTSSPTMPPPAPPPRRVNTLNRRSLGSPVTALSRESDSSHDFRRPSMESDGLSFDESTTNDVLADLAALQMEVDALKDKQGH